ncbi:hypothetical protein [Wolbachia endosymbiont of Armadillidium arcangelii]|uniref:Transposase n=1 Tax=Wolbachia endosymbiont of Armadillidium arcangelii TaxID=3158571 RepID=A0AAU7Q1F6_9RICK
MCIKNAGNTTLYLLFGLGRILELTTYQKETSTLVEYENYKYGIKKWKKKVKYGTRSYIEAFFYRLKQIFGFSFKNKSEINREKELLIKC